MSLLCYVEVLKFFTLRPSDIIISLTYVLMYNFCSYFLYYLKTIDEFNLQICLTT